MDKKSPEADQPQWPPLVLRRTDQATSAVLAVISLLLIAIWAAAQMWQDGQSIDIERAEPIAIDFKIDANTAQWQELALMPNIGEQLAKRIVADRTERGPFQDIDDLLRVRGIGPRTLETMRPFLLPLPAIQSTADNPPQPQPAKIN